MAQNIQKSTLVAEIKRKKDICKKIVWDLKIKENQDYYQGKGEAYKEVLDLLDTIKVKEVDLKEEIKEDWIFADKTEVDCLECMCLTEDMFVSLAKKYFQLGIKAQKGKEV